MNELPDRSEAQCIRTCDEMAAEIRLQMESHGIDPFEDNAAALLEEAIKEKLNALGDV